MIPSVSAEADQELTDAAVYYTREANAELGAAFIDEFERVLALLCEQPSVGAVWRGKRRRFPLRRFPYSVVYDVVGDELRVIALAHHRRQPEYWAGRS